MQKSDVFSALLYEFKTPHVPALELGGRLTGLGQRQFKTKLKKNEFAPSFQNLFHQDSVSLDELAEVILQRRSEHSYE
ncbi:hypothetical protein J5X92_17325 [Alteromonas sp. K632G]|uniref:hypothetical protein n=1 Tax=Alteromonas sp. K632G TaxID=2820757 RepID=UPI001AD7894B|nr:hypothetical protein [Alteromonas sp. K632G]MBO7923969.1 hypothetical protein [Alteromonas sp. K632G]